MSGGAVKHAVVREAATARASGKVILLGEHVVVHGYPAIVAALDRGVAVTVSPRPPDHASVAAADLHLTTAIERAASLLGIDARGFDLAISGDLPVGMGLGSSAALAVAMLRALSASAGEALGDQRLASGAHEIERVFHGTPSGVDSTAAAFGGVRWFIAGSPVRHEQLVLPAPLPLVVVLSRTPHTTMKTVGGLRERAAAAPAVYQPVFAAVGALVASARVALEQGDHALLGALMTMNHGLLRACGVSTAELDALVDDALAAGARGAKLTGAGGGGAVIALPAGEAAALVAALEARGHECFAVLLA